MFRVPKEVSGFNGSLQYVDSCPNSLVPGMAFCDQHCLAANEKGIPTGLRAFLQHCGVKCKGNKKSAAIVASYSVGFHFPPLRHG